jgi:hypothetical protein
MQLSDDKTTLLKVDNNDLINGTFIIPEGVTTIGGCAFAYCNTLTQVIIPDEVTTIGVFAFLSCSALSQITIPKGIIEIGINTFLDCSALTQVIILEGVKRIGVGAFHNCSRLTQIIIPEGIIRIDDFAFLGCNNLHVIAVNTSNDAALKEARNLLPEEHRTKIIKKSLYDDVIKFQQAAYQSMPHDPRANAFIEFYIFYHAKIPLPIFSLMSGFEIRTYQNFNKKAGRLPIPSTEADFQQYKHDFNVLFGLALPEEPSQPQKITEDVLEPRLLCIAQLRKYVGFITHKKEIIQEKKPAFFTENKTLLLEINNQIKAIEKTIAFLRGGSERDIRFTAVEIARLEKGFVGKTLGRLINRLPLEPALSSCAIG